VTGPADRRPLVDATVPPRLGARRTEVLEQLRDAAAPCSVAQVAEDTGLHVNTARFHLDALATQGLVERRSEASGVPGRPRILYSARAGQPGTRSFRLLGQMLSGLVAELDPHGSASAELGRTWGRALVRRVADGGDQVGEVEDEPALQRLDEMLDEVGFAPTTSPGEDGGVEVRLHQCPFLEVATERSEVVCAVHRGLMEGALTELGAPYAVAELRPFVRPDLCVARLRRR
jgi:predicted ArsR family transcriptional regulator